MKKFILLAAFINIIFFNACSSETAKFSKVNATNVNSANNSVVAGADNANLPPSDGNTDFNIARANNRTLVNAPANYKEPGAVKPAGVANPYNSTITTTMNKQNEFLEVREFKDDPMLLKVERLQQRQKITVYLKNGKIVNMPYEKNELFITASPAEILTAAGITPPTVKPAADDNSKKVPPTKKEPAKNE